MMLRIPAGRVAGGYAACSAAAAHREVTIYFMANNSRLRRYVAPARAAGLAECRVELNGVEVY